MLKKVRRNKTPPPEKKRARIPPETEAWAQQPFRWRVNDYYIDMEDGEWGWGCVPINDFFEILKKSLQKYEGMSWDDVLRRTSCHPMPVHRITRRARDRFAMLCPDVDTLHQVDFSEFGRVWGVKSRAYLQLVWHDPHHTVCPTKRR